MTRIVSGRFGGRRIATPPGQDTRPTSDRVREALFSTVDSMLRLRGSRFLDLYAGSGAIGLEALSRGADQVLLVEADARAARVARDNVATLGAGTSVRLTTAKVDAVLRGGPDAPYDIVFADPPYAAADDEVARMLEELVAKGWLATGALIIVERSSRSPQPGWAPGITAERSRRYGETTLWYGRATGDQRPEPMTDPGEDEAGR